MSLNCLSRKQYFPKNLFREKVNHPNFSNLTCNILQTHNIYEADNFYVVKRGVAEFYNDINIIFLLQIFITNKLELIKKKKRMP